MGMKNEKKGFFSRMLSSEHKVFGTYTCVSDWNRLLYFGCFL